MHCLFRRFLAVVLWAFLLVSTQAAPKPNIVLFFADDLGWNGLGCFGSDFYETPHLDQLAREGVKFTDAYSACTVCSPSRAALMTGKYPARLHVTDFIAGQNRPFAKLRIPDWTKYLPHEEVTIAEALKTADYKSAHVGKWHLDPKGSPDPKRDGPVGHGFDREVLKPAAKGYFLRKNDRHPEIEEGDYLTDYLAEQAAGIVTDWKDEPFFLYFAFHVPHTPIQGRPDLVDHFRKKLKLGLMHHNPEYAAMVRSMDDAVGRVLEALRENGLADKTVIIFTSDNGGLTERYGKWDDFTDNSPLRRGKGSGYEGGVRVPMIVKWPGVTPVNEVCDEPVIGIDFFPTIMDLAGVTDAGKVDGLSLVPLFRNPATSLKRDAVYWHYPHYHAGANIDGPYGAVRSGKWRLVQFYEDGGEALYDLSQDVGESRDVAEANPDIAAKLRRMLDKWRVEVGAQMPVPNPDFDPARATKVGKGDD